MYLPLLNTADVKKCAVSNIRTFIHDNLPLHVATLSIVTML